MKKAVIFILVLAGIIAIGAGYRSLKNTDIGEKVYVAAEGDGNIAVIDPRARKIIRVIDLSSERDGENIKLAPHNVQVAPDGKSVWVTANAGAHERSSSIFLPRAYAHSGEPDSLPMNDADMMNMMSSGHPADEVIVIDPETERIIKRIEIGRELHLAHVALTPDSAFAYATAQGAGKIYKIDAHSFEILKIIVAPKGSEPHGIRIAPNGSAAYIAMLKGKALGILDMRSGALTQIQLRGQAVQTGVTPDGKVVAISLYDTKQVAIYNVGEKSVSYINLPERARGPIQLYATPDSDFIYVADQGYYFGQPIGEVVYKIDLRGETVVGTIKAGDAPHGVAISPDGARVYVTNLLSGDLSIIDANSDTEIGRVKVGKEPNGVSVWSKK